MGEVTFYKATPSICFNFKKVEIDGKKRYTYLQASKELGEGISTTLPSKLMVLDENYSQINEISYFTDKENTNNTNYEKKLDSHDYLYLSDNHYLLAGFEMKTVYDFPSHEKEAFCVWNCKIQEVLNGEILWEFESIKNPNLYHYCNENTMKIMSHESYLDYMHFNSMQIDPIDGNLLCSFRNIDSIIKLDRKTGKIIWVLGGIGDEFGLTEDQKFSNQHSISFLSNHSILIYDNGCKNKKTRVIVIQLEEQNKTIKEYHSYDLNIISAWMGSVQAINEEKNTYLVTYGVGNNPYGFQELNLETLEPITSFKLKENNSLYCVNKIY